MVVLGAPRTRLCLGCCFSRISGLPVGLTKPLAPSRPLCSACWPGVDSTQRGSRRWEGGSRGSSFLPVFLRPRVGKRTRL